jgi:tRNA A-37 threonylcarbamoyl transferase component Bud32
MPSYADVVTGRLLLQEGVPLEVLRDALRELSGSPGAPLLEATARRRAVDVARLRTQAGLVEVAERERALARLLYLDGSVPQEALRASFEEVRRAGFREGLGPRLVAQGTLPKDKVGPAYAECDAALDAARKERADGLGRLAQALGRGEAVADDALKPALELCAVDAILAARRPPKAGFTGAYARPDKAPSGVTGRLTSPPATGRLEPVEGAKTQATLAAASAPDIAPEDCPIYGYEIVRELGKGSMGVVYKARHVTSNRMTALKVLPLRLAAKTQYLERFKREAMALMRIDHDNVVRAYDFGGSEDYYYLALEFVEGETLDKTLKREELLPERRALDLCRQIARGLGAASDVGIVHRDVKPENIIVTPEGVAKLVDFGIVKLLDMDEGTVTVAGTTVGTPFYISPEQARGEEDLDIRADLYSLGITLFQLATGKVPFTGKSQGAILVRHILEEVPDPRSLRPDLGEGLVRIVRKLTRKRREERFATPGEVAAAVDELLGAASASAGAAG